MKSKWARLAWLPLMATLMACSPASSVGQPGPSPAQSNPAQPQRTLQTAVRLEPASVATRAFVQAGVALYLSKRMFNAELSLLDPNANPHPYLAEALPQLNSDDWQVMPDGRMETTHHLKSNLSWHDGTPLSAEDFVFSWRVYTNPELGQANLQPFASIEDVSAPDDRTLRIRWRRPYPDAAALIDRDREFPPLPRHLLQTPFVAADADAFISNPFWTRDYVGLGPYRLVRWEPGTAIEAVPFDQHVLGRAKIERIRIIFIQDSSVTLAHLLSGEVQFVGDGAFDVEGVPTLRKEWADLGGVILHPNQWRSTVFQLRPELATPRSILDSRVRKALAHTVEKSSINEAVYAGGSLVADFMIPAISAYGGAIDRSIAKYPYDLRRGEQLMNDAGFTRAADGMFASAAEGRFVVEAKTNASADNASEQAVLASEWRRAGFDVQESILPAAQSQDNQVRATYPGMFTFNTALGIAALMNHTSERFPRAENRWQGGNRGGWSNAGFDRLGDSFNTTLDQSERERQAVEMAKLISDDEPEISLFFRTQPWIHVKSLSGPQLVAPESNMTWNIYEWEFR
jgi:peptide/nickel transport system substrate-binding protein